MIKDGKVRMLGSMVTPMEAFNRIRRSPAWKGAEVFFPGPDQIGLRFNELWRKAEVVIYVRNAELLRRLEEEQTESFLARLRAAHP